MRRLVDDGQYDQADMLIRAADTAAFTNPEMHLELAGMCAEAGLEESELKELNLARRDADSSPELLRRIAEMHSDSGRVAEAASCLRRVISISHDNADAWKELISVTGDAEGPEAEAAVCREAYGATGDVRFKGCERDSQYQRQAGISEEYDRSTAWMPGDSHLLRFQSLFSGREDVYARQWQSASGGTGYTPVREPVTPSVIKQHILGNHTLGFYQLRMDNTVSFIAFDVDIPKGLIPSLITDSREWNAANARIIKYGLSVSEKAAKMDTAAYIEHSGFKGCHCWILLDRPMPAATARKFATYLLKEAGSPPEGASVEIFPKQVSLNKDGLGNLIKVPFGLHRRSGKRALFIEPASGEPAGDQLSFLMNIRQTPAVQIEDILRENQFSTVLDIAGTDRGTGVKDASAPRTSPQSREKQYDLELDEDFQYLIYKCPVLKSILEQINTTGRISADERIVLTHSIGHLKSGPDAVNALLARCPGTDPSLFLKSRLRANPISCPRIRQRIPHITSSVNCACRFDVGANTYPTPTLHLQTREKTVRGQGIQSLNIQRLVQEYVETRKKAREISELLDKYTAELKKLFEESGVDSIQTSMGLLKPSKEGFTLEI